MEPVHDHAPEAKCLPACPAWSLGALELYQFQRRYAEMLEACRMAETIEYVYVTPSAPNVRLPDFLLEEDVVRLTLVVGRDTPEVLLDDWGIRARLSFRGRPFDCAFPWPAVLGGVLRAPRRPRFGVIEGGKKD